MPFIFEKLEVYKKAKDFAGKTLILCKDIKDRNIVNQLVRASISIPLNIAEGQGRVHSREKKQFYNIAKGSLYECLPLLQICADINYIDQIRYQELYELMNEIGRMLAGLIKSVDEREMGRI